MILFLVAALVAASVVPSLCIGFASPVVGEVVRGFLPTGRYSGHWGIDIVALAGSRVRSAGDGTVSFSGVVVGNNTVTVDHGGVRTSYSYLSERLVSSGDRVRRGDVVGTIGSHEGNVAVHFSVRIGDRYVDPSAALRCDLDPHVALWLRAMSTQTPYPRLHASHSRRNIRPPAHRPPRRGRDGAGPTRCRPHHLHTGWTSVAEARHGGVRSPPPPPHDRTRDRGNRLLHRR